MDLLETKLVPPIEPRRLIARPRLQAYLERLTHTRLTLVQTPAGYGKTSVLWHWHQALREQQQYVGWISLDGNDRDSVSVLAYIANALANYSGSMSQVARQFRFNKDYLRVEPMVNLIANSLASSTRPVYLFIDDIHLAADNVLKTLQRLIEAVPGTVHFVISCRVAPPFALAKMRVSGDLLEFNTQDLLFQMEEIERFLLDQGHDGLGVEELQALESRTEGWITGIKLASLAWQSDINVRDFFAELLSNLVYDHQAAFLSD